MGSGSDRGKSADGARWEGRGGGGVVRGGGEVSD